MTQNVKTRRLRKSKTFPFLAALSLFSAIGFAAQAQTQNSPDWQDLSFESAGLFVRSWNENPKEFQKVFQETLYPSVSTHPWFKNQLPSQWALLIDGTWTLSPGFWSDTLQAPNGSPAILIRPQTTHTTDRGLSLIAHELTHLMHYQRRPQEDSWVREGLAMLGEYRVTGIFNSSIYESFAQPETSLISEFDPREKEYQEGSNRSATYGHVLLYFHYLYRLCGGQDLMDELLTSPSAKAGIDFIDEVLSRRAQNKADADPVCAGFKTSFRAFELARFHQNPAIKSDYVVSSVVEPALRDSPPSSLPRYSATAYRLKADSQGKFGKCPAGDVAWGTRRCIRIRAE